MNIKEFYTDNEKKIKEASIIVELDGREYTAQIEDIRYMIEHSSDKAILCDKSYIPLPGKIIYMHSFKDESVTICLFTEEEIENYEYDQL